MGKLPAEIFQGGIYDRYVMRDDTRQMRALQYSAFAVKFFIMQHPDTGFEEAFGKTIDLGNRIADNEDQPDTWDVADGLLAGALQFWLYSRQPCGDVSCEDCAQVSTAQGRMRELRKLIEQFATESEYFHSPLDSDVGRA